MQTPQDTPVMILCGGLGTRLKEETEFRPKPMVPIGPHPILWHIMQLYSRCGFRRFILCLGFKSEVIKAYFLHYPALESDFTIALQRNTVDIHDLTQTPDWEVTLADTGAESMTGYRLYLAAQNYLGNAEHIAVTYGDGLTNAHLGRVLQFHQEHGKIGTMMGVHPLSRYGEMQLDGDIVTSFHEKPALQQTWVNGGFFFFQRSFFSRFLHPQPSLVLEKEPLMQLVEERQLAVFRHLGFWGCMDTHRDREMLNGLWNSGQAPWMTTLSTTLSAGWTDKNSSLTLQGKN